MAKKQNRFDFAEFQANLLASAPKPTQIEIKEERKYFLIVSEGTRTEPIYFKYLASLLPPNLVNTIEVNGAGDNTVNVVRKAIALRNKRRSNRNMPPYDEVWAVYDKDDFPAKRYNGAIFLADSEGIKSAHSNQSFELWYVLHYEYLQSALHRTDYIRKLTGHMGLPYTKNTPRVVEQLLKTGNVNQAIERAKSLEIIHVGKTPTDSCPHTSVYKLVETLNRYIDDHKPKNMYR